MNVNSLAIVVDVKGQCKLSRGQREIPLGTESELLAHDIIDTRNGELVLRNQQGKLIRIPQGYKVPITPLTLQLLINDKNNVLAFFAGGTSPDSNNNKEQSDQMTYYYSGLLLLLLLSAYEVNQVIKYAESGLSINHSAFDFTLTKLLYETVTDWFGKYGLKQPDSMTGDTMLSSGSYDNLTNQSPGSTLLTLNNFTTGPGAAINTGTTTNTLLFIPTEEQAPPSTPLVITDSGNPANLQDIVFEAGLPGIGSQAGQTGTLASGTFTISNADGLSSVQSVTINNTLIPIANLGNNNAIVSPNGIFTITGYNSATGVATYTFQLTSPAGDQDNNIFSVTASNGTNTSPLATIVIDIASDKPIAHNDVNSVQDNISYLANGNVITGADGSSADTLGANGFGSIVWTGANAGILKGAHGTLAVGTDGSYSYTLNADPAVKALDDGKTLTELFTYTLTDGDGDSAQATLTVIIKGSNDAPTIITDSGNPGNAADIVYEAGLPNGSHIGPTSITASGTFTLADPDGLADIKSVTINGQTILIGNLAGASVTGQNGALTITSYNSATGVASYSYTLQSPAKDEPGTETNQFTLTTSDGATSSAPATIIINITDDQPKACNDVDSVKHNYNFAADGNVITGTGGYDANTTDGARDIVGADGFAAIIWKNAYAGMISAAHGNLFVGTDGSYSYLLNNDDPAVKALDEGQSLKETFSYTLIDGDGDKSEACLTIIIQGSNDAPTIITDSGNPGNAPDVVYEAGLPIGSQIGPTTITASGTFTLADPDGLADIKSVTINGQTILIGNLAGASITGPNGTLTISGYNSNTGVATYNYTLQSPATDLPAVTETNLFTLTTSDGTTSSAPATIIINIFDDAPKACPDVDSVREDSALIADGNVVTGSGGSDANNTDGNADKAGADGFASIVWQNAIGDIIPSLHGVLFVGQDGSYRYLLNNDDPVVQALDDGQSLVEVFTYTIFDKDGDGYQSTLTITISGNNDAPTIITDSGNQGNAPDVVYEAGLPNGSHIGPTTITATGTFTLADPDGLADIKSVTINGQTILIGNLGANNIISGPNGILTVTGYNSTTGVATYSYTLQTPATDGPGTEVSSFSLTTSDGTTQSAAANIVIVITDDLPIASANSGIVNEGGCLSVNAANGVLANDIAGADGYAAGGGVIGVRAGSDTSTPAISGVNTGIQGKHGLLTLHADGSWSYQSFANSINGAAEDVFVYSIKDADGDIATTTLTINLIDSGLIATNDDEVLVYEKAIDTTITGADIAAGTITGSLGTSSPLETDASNTLTNNTSGGFGSKTYTLLSSQTGSYGTIQLNSDGTYIYTLTQAFHSSDENADQTEQNRDSFTYQVSDANGNTATGTIFVDIVDDVPLLGAFQNAVVNNQGGSATGNFDVNFGADGPATTGSVFQIGGPATAIPGLIYTTQTMADGSRLVATSNGTQVFTLEVHNDGHYDFNLINNPLSTQNIQVVAGNASLVEINGGLIEITGSGPINGSQGTGFGIGNNFFDTANNDSFTMEFHSVGSPGDTPANVNPDYAEAVKLWITDERGSGMKFMWTATGANGSIQSGEVSYNPALGYVIIDPTISFNQITITPVDTNGVKDSFRIQSIDIYKSLLPSSQPLNFQISATDGDGDKSTTSNLTIAFNSSQIVTPVVLDLNHDGFTFVTHDDPSNHVLFDYGNNGQLQATAWIGSQDGFLAFDANGDQQVNNGSEMVFSDPAKGAYTDLQGLAVNYDSNADGFLDKNDASFSNFGVWVDANSNGISDPGEFTSLTDSGITSINLQGSGGSYTAANGEVIVQGESTFSYADGSTGKVADVSLTTYDATTNNTAPPASPEQTDLSGDHSDLLPLLAYFSDLGQSHGNTGLETAIFHDFGINMNAAQIKEFLAGIMEHLNVAQQGHEDMTLDIKALLSSDSSQELDLKSLDPPPAIDETHKTETPAIQPVEASAGDYCDKGSPAHAQSANIDASQVHAALAPVAQAETPIPPVVHVA